MGTLIADIFVTVKPTQDRFGLTASSLASLIENTDKSQFRLTVCIDGRLTVPKLPKLMDPSIDATRLVMTHADYVLFSEENEGLGPTINRAVAHIKSINDWYGHPTHGNPFKVAPLVVMCQDDLLYTKDWLPTLASRFFAFEKSKNLGFASGVECIEHPIKEDFGGFVLKDWIRASQMMGRREYWESLMPIPRFDPETGRVRAKPNDGMGSGVDWWLIRNHENSVCRTGRTCLVMPGLVQHAGYKKSTWLDRELPESESDKEKMKNA